jgi:predicted nucleotidyltransferase
MPQISEFCQRWQITELALFGSVLRDDFRPDSDIDCLVKFSDDAHWTLLHIGKMEDELKTIFQRDVDLSRFSVNKCTSFSFGKPSQNILSGYRIESISNDII